MTRQGNLHCVRFQRARRKTSARTSDGDAFKLQQSSQTPLVPIVSSLSCSLFGWLVADGWCWFVLREKYCWLVADKPNEQGGFGERLRFFSVAIVNRRLRELNMIKLYSFISDF
jgi:hypothetical protein